jgi:ABC-type dipeptide/oligopeptide/nickel transport system permease subunit
MAQSQAQPQPGNRALDVTDLKLREEAGSFPAPTVEAEAATLAELGAATEVSSRRQASLWGDAWRRLIRNRLAVIGMVIVVSFTIIAVAAPVIAPYNENDAVFDVLYDDSGRLDQTDYRIINELKGFAPSWTWPMGLDQNGRDVFSRMMYGARVSLVVGVLAQVIILLIGVPIGAAAGYYGGQIDNILMRVVDVVYAIPQLLLVLLIVNWRGPGLANIFLAIGLVGWVTETRLVRGQFLSLREQEYVKAAKVAGASGPYIIARHLLPNSLTPIIVALTFGIPTAIFTEAALSFVGVGIRPPQASWGQMVGEGQEFVRSYPHLLLFPSLAIGLTMLGFTFLGDGLRDALDPKGND